MVGDRGWRHAAWVALFVLPGFSALFLFIIGPILASLVLTLFEWDLLTDPTFVGADNFRRILTDDAFWAALRHTVTYIVGYVPLVMVFALTIALALLWTWMFNPRFGLINYGLGKIGVDGPGWLYDRQWAMPAIILTSVWKDLGFVMVVFLAGLQSIPRDYYEAASLDGASGWERLKSITLPLLAPPHSLSPSSPSSTRSRCSRRSGS